MRSWGYQKMIIWGLQGDFNVPLGAPIQYTLWCEKASSYRSLLFMPGTLILCKSGGQIHEESDCWQVQG